MYKTVMMNDVEQLMKKEKVQVLDVREEEEFEEGHIPGAMMTPISSFMKYVPMLNKSIHYHVVCYSGARSQVVAEYLGKQGYQVTNVMGGMSTYRGKLAYGQE
jgi:rhodanese-related sulfurtransferase